MGKYHPSHHVNEWIRYILYGFNFLLWFLSLVILLIGLIGIWIREDKLSITSYVQFLTDPAAILVAIGALVFFVTFFGCVGALNENCLFLRIYFVLLIIIFVIEIICGILAFAFSGPLEEEVNDVIAEGIRQYRFDADLTNFIDFAQRELECCGSSGHLNDWSNNQYFNCSNTELNGLKNIDASCIISLLGLECCGGSGHLNDWSNNQYFNCSNTELNGLKNVEACGVPYSCCVGSDDEIINTQCGLAGGEHNGQTTLINDQIGVFHTEDCIEKLQQELRTRSFLIGFTVFVVAALQLIGIFLAYELCRELEMENRNYLRHSATPS